MAEGDVVRRKCFESQATNDRVGIQGTLRVREIRVRDDIVLSEE